MSIKIPLFSLQKTSWPGRPVNDPEEDEINTSPLEADGNQEVFDFILSPVSRKGTWISNSRKMFLWDASSPSLWCAHFLDKITFPGPNSWSLDYWPVTCKQDELRLSNISKTTHCTPRPGLFNGPSFFFSIVFLYPSCQFYAPPPHCGWLFRLRQPMAVPSGADQSVLVHTEGIGSPWSSEGEGWKSGSGEHSGKI